MRLIKPYVEILDEIDGAAILNKIELIGRVCYKSEDQITKDSSLNFVKMLLKRGHESVIEHEKVSVRVVCDRGVSHEIVRHRIASYSQESTRYCNYSQSKFGSELTFIEPCFWQLEQDERKKELLINQLTTIEKTYFLLIGEGASPQEARAILPNLLKTEIVMTMNLREWRHFFRLRTSSAAHPQMQEIANLILDEFQKSIPVLFDNI